jgi:FkbM family methyltransferase
MSLVSLVRFITSHPLNRNDRLGALARLVKWQVASRLQPGDHVQLWINQSRFLVRRGETGLTGNIYTGLHEFHDMAFVLHLLRPSDLFVDVGANVGSYTILASAVTGARTLCFEPVPGTHDRLLKNIGLNRIGDRVTALNKGVGREVGNLSFTAGLDTVNHVVSPTDAAAATVSVEVTTLDRELAEHSPVLMKIDVEGYETPVLEGAGKVLANPSLRGIVIELNGSGARYGFDEAAMIVHLQRLGFAPYRYEPFARRLAAIEGKNDSAGNTLFVRDVAWVAARLRQAPMMSVHGKTF